MSGTNGHCLRLELHGGPAALRKSFPAPLLGALRADLLEPSYPLPQRSERLNIKCCQHQLFISPLFPPRYRVEQATARRRTNYKGTAPPHSLGPAPQPMCTRTRLAGSAITSPTNLSLGHLPRTVKIPPLALLTMSGVLLQL